MVANTGPKFPLNYDVHVEKCGTGKFRTGNGKIGNESVLIQLAYCWFSGLAISNAKK